MERVPLGDIRRRVKAGLEELRGDHKRHLNPTPYKVSLSEDLYNMTQATWTSLTPKHVLK